MERPPGRGPARTPDRAGRENCMLERPLSILQVSLADHGGGAELSAWNLFEAYRARGHGSKLAVGFRHGDDPDVVLIPNDACRGAWARLWLAAGRLQAAAARIRGGRRLHTALRFIAEPGAWLDRLRGVEDFRYPGTWRLLGLLPQPPEILHCHNLHGGYFDLRALPQLSRRVPVILNLRDAWLLSGHCAHSLDCDRWRLGCGHCPYLGTYPAVRRDATAENWRRKQSIYQQSHLYIATPSRWMMEKVQASMLRGAGFRVIPNAINLSIFRPGSQAQARRALGLPPGAKVVLLTAQNEFKDYATMEAALARLPGREGEQLLFVCLGKAGQAQAVGAGRMVCRPFEFDAKRVVLHYQAADVFIHAAKDEVFGKTVTEAMGCAVPVVATAVGGVPEQIEDGRTGFLVPGKDPEAMAAAAARLLGDPALCRQIGAAAAAHVRHTYSLDAQVDRFLEWYHEVREHWQAAAAGSALARIG